MHSFLNFSRQRGIRAAARVLKMSRGLQEQGFPLLFAEEMEGKGTKPESVFSFLPPSRLLVLEDELERPPLAAGDYLKRLLETASLDLPPEKILETVRKVTGRDYPTLLDFIAGLRPRFHVPWEICAGMVQELVSEGMDPSKVPRVVFRGSPPSHYFRLLQLFLISYFLNQKWWFPKLDLLSCAFLAQRHYSPRHVNMLMVDVRLERAEGNRRRARVYGIPLHRDLLKPWVGFIWKEMLKIFPSGFREPKAKVSIASPSLLWQSENGFWLPLSIRPSIIDLASRHGLAVTTRGQELFINGKRAGVLDYDPDRVRNRGIYRMTAEVRKEGPQVIVDESPPPFAPAEEAIFMLGHRYHIDRSLALFELIVDYQVNLPRSYFLFYSLKPAALLWKRVGRRGKSEPWSDLLDLVETRAEPRMESTGQPEPALSPEVAAFVAEHGLTAREAEVLRLVLTGVSNREIARKLEIQEITVKSHMSNILQKSGFKNCRELLAFFLATDEERH